MLRYAFRENLDDLALILCLENGKTLVEAKGEVTYAATFLEWFAGEAERTYGEVVPVANQNQRILTFKVGPAMFHSSPFGENRRHTDVVPQSNPSASPPVSPHGTSPSP